MEQERAKVPYQITELLITVMMIPRVSSSPLFDTVLRSFLIRIKSSQSKFTISKKSNQYLLIRNVYEFVRKKTFNRVNSSRST